MEEEARDDVEGRSRRVERHDCVLLRLADCCSNTGKPGKYSVMWAKSIGRRTIRKSIYSRLACFRGLGFGPKPQTPLGQTLPQTLSLYS